MSVNHFNIRGLSNEEVAKAREQFGKNALSIKSENNFLKFLIGLAKEPMVLLLLLASGIYFITGNIGDGLFLAAAIILVAAISIYQDSRSKNAIEKLKTYSQATCKVIRNGETIEIDTEDLVIGDALMVEEGSLIVADGEIIHSNDFSVNEAILTGESMAVFKGLNHDDHRIFHGSSVASGLAIARVTAIGNHTALAKIGKRIEGIEDEKTPLELQISNFVKKMVIAGAIVFLIVWAKNYLLSYDILDSLLKALTLAMSILPEEIPVAFATFMALGAWRLMKMGIVVKQMKTVETLGSATVICIDKTGTITENKMHLQKIFTLQNGEHENFGAVQHPTETELIKIAMFASEPIPFDPMEIALHEAYAQTCTQDERSAYKMIHEYPLGGKPPMMTHIFENAEGDRIIAAKGAPEAIMAVSKLSESQYQTIERAISEMASRGFRVLGVSKARPEIREFPQKQQEFEMQFLGLLAFFDPPKKNIGEVLNAFYKAGLGVKIVTGDNALTTATIAREIGFRGAENTMSGDDLMGISEDELKEKVKVTQVFTRMFPEAKLRIINALKRNNEVVAMTGDGVNDGPALKASHIGIAMGKKGTEIAKQAANLILTEDDLQKMVEAIAMGRKIYTNLKKAIQYVISIHIPIILVVFIPLALGWVYPNIFTPVHIIFLELIMGPTCSIIYENEPMEKNTMIQKPRPFSVTFFNWQELTTSIIQGLMITAGTLLVYQIAVVQGQSEALTRTLVFSTLISANIFLTLVNRSFYYSILHTLGYHNKLVPLIIAITISITASLLFFDPFTQFFKFEQLSSSQIGLCLGIGFLSVIWFEPVKWIRRMQLKE